MPDGTLSDKQLMLELYKLVADTRKFEIENFGRRSLFFWGALAIILAGYFQIEKYYQDYLIFISFLGFVYTLIFSLSVRGSKFWQENWEQKVVHFQDKLKKLYPKEFESDFNVFGTPLHKAIKEKESEHSRLLRSYRFSVSKLVLILSDITLLLMFCLFVNDCFSLFSTIKWEICNNDYKPHYKAIAFILVFALSCIYLLLFLLGERKRNIKLLKNQKDEIKVESNTTQDNN